MLGSRISTSYDKIDEDADVTQRVKNAVPVQQMLLTGYWYANYYAMADRLKKKRKGTGGKHIF